MIQVYMRIFIDAGQISELIMHVSLITTYTQQLLYVQLIFLFSLPAFYVSFGSSGPLVTSHVTCSELYFFFEYVIFYINKWHVIHFVQQARSWKKKSLQLFLLTLLSFSHSYINASFKNCFPSSATFFCLLLLSFLGLLSSSNWCFYPIVIFLEVFNEKPSATESNLNVLA